MFKVSSFIIALLVIAPDYLEHWIAYGYLAYLVIAVSLDSNRSQRYQ